MKLHEIANEGDLPLIWELVRRKRSEGKRVSISAAVDIKSGPSTGERYLTGEIMDVGAKAVEIYADRRMWYARIHDDDDQHLTFAKDEQSDFFWVRNTQVSESDVRPMVWQLAAQRLEKGESVLFHAHLPNSSSYLVGRVRVVGATRALIDNIYRQQNDVSAVFTDDDDHNLTITRSNNPDIADWVIRDNK